MSAPPAELSTVHLSRLTVHIDPSVGDPGRFRERRHVLAVLDAAQAHPAWPEPLHSAVVVSAHRRHTTWPALERTRSPPLVVALGNEDAVVRPALRQRSAAVLQQYVQGTTTGGPPVLHLPLGPGSLMPPPPPVPWDQRDLDVLFVGHLHQRRWSLARALGAVHPLASALPEPLLPLLGHRILRPVRLAGRTVRIQFTPAFGAGLPHPQYLDLLARTRVALVPRGFKQLETYRHFEAARAGCVLVGSPLPHTPFPVLAPPERALLPWLAALLADPDRLLQLHHDVRAAYAAHGHPKAVGQALAQRLGSSVHPPGAPPPG